MKVTIDGRQTTGSDEKGSLCNTTVLLVEDEDGVRDITRLVLERAGYRVISCKDAAYALRIGPEATQTVDVLLTDVVMPGMNGIELAKRLKAEAPRLAMVCMTGYSEASALEGFAGIHLQKPFTVTQLLSRIAEAVSQNSRESPARYTNSQSRLGTQRVDDRNSVKPEGHVYHGHALEIS